MSCAILSLYFILSRILTLALLAPLEVIGLQFSIVWVFYGFHLTIKSSKCECNIKAIIACKFFIYEETVSNVSQILSIISRVQDMDSD